MTGLRQHWQRLPHAEQVKAYIQILLGCIIGGAAYPLFLTPSLIAPGGLTGVSTILYHFFGLPVGITSLVMNIPLFLIGYRSVGGVFVIRSLTATLFFSLSIDLLNLEPLTTDPLLAAVFGGITLGVGLGLILRGGGTTGGTDMIARMVHRRFQSVTVGMFLFAIDFVVVVAVAVFLGSGEALYALIAIGVSSKVIDMVMAGFTANKACFIMTPRWQEVTDRVMNGMQRGVTQLSARGGWSGEERPVILCVVSRQELPMVKAVVHEVDEHAFMFVTEAYEALGEGFSPLNPEG